VAGLTAGVGEGLARLRVNRQSLRAARACVKATAAGLAQTGARFAIAPDVDATEIRLPYTGRTRIGIGIRGVVASDVSRWCAEAAGTLGFAASTVVVTGGGIDPISSSSTAFAVGHLRPPGMS
jgi:hypothetical protein